MIADTVTIQYKAGDVFKLLPLADIHYGHSTCDSRKLKQDLKEQVDDKTVIVGVGDWLDMIIMKDIKRYRKAFDEIEGEDVIDEQIQGLAEILKPYSKNIIAIGDGNHEDSIISLGTNPTKRLIQLLKTEDHEPIYMGYSWLLALMFQEPTNGKAGRGRTCTIRAHHGWGGSSRTEGADITKYSHDVKFWQADLFLYGHTHRLKVNDVEEGRMIGKSSWKTFKKKMVVCGSYQRTYSKGTTATWAERKGFSPISVKCPIVYLKPHWESGVDITVMS